MQSPRAGTGTGWAPAFGLLWTLLACNLSAQAEGYFDVAASEVFNSRNKRFGHLEYMGFYGSAMRQWNFTAELAPFTNLTWIETGNTDAVIQRMYEARDAGVGVVLSVQPVVFDSKFRLRDDYLYNLSVIQDRIVSAGLADTIVMVYTVDEPLHRAANSRRTTRRQMLRDIEQVNSDLRTLFPDKPLGVIFGADELSRDDFRVPESYDWVGFNCYDSLWDCKGKPMTSYYSRLLDVMTPEQMLMVVPEAWMKYSDYQREDWETREIWERRNRRHIRNLRKRLLHHYEIALSEPRVIAFIPFIWSMDAEEGRPQNSGFGVNRFEQHFPQGGAAFVDTLTDIGYQIKRGEYRYPNLKRKQTESSSERPASRVQAELVDVSGRGNISAWALDHGLSHKNLRMQVAVYLDGELLYRSKPRRSFVRDTEIASRHARTLPAVGTHGYRHRLPRSVYDQLRGAPVEIELRVMADGAGRKLLSAERYDVVLD